MDIQTENGKQEVEMQVSEIQTEMYGEILSRTVTKDIMFVYQFQTLPRRYIQLPQSPDKNMNITKVHNKQLRAKYHQNYGTFDEGYRS
jgi:hypothetical protein